MQTLPGTDSDSIGCLYYRSGIPKRETGQPEPFSYLRKSSKGDPIPNRIVGRTIVTTDAFGGLRRLPRQGMTISLRDHLLTWLR